MASDVILDDDVVFRVMRVIADPIHYFCKAYQ